MPTPHTTVPARAQRAAKAPAASPTTEVGQRWGRIPAWWLDHPDLDADGLAVLAALSTYADELGVCWPSQTTLAAKLKRSRPTINRIVGRLEAMDLLTVEHRNAANGGRLSCRYRLRLIPNDTVADPQSHPLTAPDSSLNAPCSTASQEQHQTKQIPDSLSSATLARDQATIDTNQPHQTVSDHWSPSPSDRLWAMARFPNADLDHHAELFRQRCQAHGYRYKNIGAAWRSWLLQDLTGRSATTAAKTGSVRSTAATTRSDIAEQRLDAWSSVAVRLSATVSSSPWARP